MDNVIVLFELVYVFNILSSIILIWNIHSKRHTEGISFYTQILFALASFIKFFYFYYSILSAYWVFWVESFVSILISSYVVYLMIKYKRLSISKEPNKLDYRLIIVVSIILAVISNLERSSKKFEWYFFAIRFANILETLGILPQLFMLYSEKFVIKPIGLFVISLLVSRVFRILFWYSLFNSYYTKDSYYILIGADALYIVFVMGLAYNVVRYWNSQVIPYN